MWGLFLILAVATLLNALVDQAIAPIRHAAQSNNYGPRSSKTNIGNTDHSKKRGEKLRSFSCFLTVKLERFHYRHIAH